MTYKNETIVAFNTIYNELEKLSSIIDDLERIVEELTFENEALIKEIEEANDLIDYYENNENREYDEEPPWKKYGD